MAIALFTPKTTLLPTSTRRKLPSPPISATALNPSYWSSAEADIRTYLQTTIPIRPPESVFEPMRHLTLGAPPTTAPSLCLAACELISGDRSPAMAAAAAIHLTAAAAHVHKHLPLGGQQAAGHAYGPNIELLTGDGMVPLGLELVARSMDPACHKNQDKVVRVIIEISRAGGARGVVDGRYREVAGGQGGGGAWAEVMEYVWRKTEGEVHGCGAACGAIMGGGTEEEIEGLRRFGVYAGTIRGMVVAMAEKGPPSMEHKIEKLRELAFRELGIFQGKKLVEVLASIVEPNVYV